MNRKHNSLMRFSRTERLAQLSEQEIVIERKKKEIQAKIEAQKKKETEEALKKLEYSKEAKTNKPEFFMRESFEDQQYLQYDSTKRTSVDSNTQQKISSSPSTHQLSTSSMTQTIIQQKMPVILHSASDSKNLGQNLTLNQFDKNPSTCFTKTQLAVPCSFKQELSESKAFEKLESQDPVKSHFHQMLSSKNLSNIQPHCLLSSQNMSSPAKFQSVSAPLPTKQNESNSKSLSESESTNVQNNPLKSSEVIKNFLSKDETLTPPFSQSNKVSDEDRTSELSSGIAKHSVLSIPFSKKSLQREETLRVSSAFYTNDDEGNHGDQLEEEHRNIAQMVARCGDEFENSLLKRNQNDPALKFLIDKNSEVYKSFRKLVQKYRDDLKYSPEKKQKRTESNEVFLENRETRFSIGESGSQETSANNEVVAETCGLPKTERKNYECQANDDFSVHQNQELIVEKECSLSSEKQLISLNSKKENLVAEEENCNQGKIEERRKRKRKTRWEDASSTSNNLQMTSGVNLNLQAVGKLPVPKTTLLSQLTRSDPGLIQYARQTFGSTNLSEEDWKKAEDHYKINLLYQDMVKKRAEIDKLEKAGKFKYEYDSDEDTEGGTWEHKLRQQEMMATQLWAEELTRQAAGKHHIGDFLPPEELERFMERYNAVKEGREPDLSDYKEFKLKQDNVGYRLLQKMGWNEGQGLGQDGSGITNPVNKATTRHENQGLGVERPDGLEAGDDEYDAYRKRMMLAYRFRPNPLNNPRRPYY